MSRAVIIKKLLALGELQHAELLQAMGGCRASVSEAVGELVSSGEVVRKQNGYGIQVYKLTADAKSSAFGGAHA